MTKKIAGFDESFQENGFYNVKEIRLALGISEHMATAVCARVRKKYYRFYESGLYGKKKVLGAHVAEVLTGNKILIF